VSWGSGNEFREDIQVSMRNNLWKSVPSGWVIMADMDEFVCVTEAELAYEESQGTTILQIRGLQMVGESQTLDLTDIDLQGIEKCQVNPLESKNLCFKRDAIVDMNFGWGSHTCSPTGDVKYSKIVYDNKHMSYLGLPYITNKIVKRYERSSLARANGILWHYTEDVDKIKSEYMGLLQNSGLPTNIS
jgi:hypothetical protein